jgi:HD-GYP domain-containing protein (c-di-GMP phosphodiesterase class II)
MALVREHPALGAGIVSQVEAIRHLAPVVRGHHERYDGTGYPDKLAGPRIPLAARIVTVCDVYDALRSRRPYRPAFSHNTALQIMSQAGAAQFDPGLLNLFLRAGDQFDRIWGRFRD